MSVSNIVKRRKKINNYKSLLICFPPHNGPTTFRATYYDGGTVHCANGGRMLHYEFFSANLAKSRRRHAYKKKK